MTTGHTHVQVKNKRVGQKHLTRKLTTRQELFLQLTIQEQLLVRGESKERSQQLLRMGSPVEEEEDYYSLGKRDMLVGTSER